jgi:hypothetical protein
MKRRSCLVVVLVAMSVFLDVSAWARPMFFSSHHVCPNNIWPNDTMEKVSQNCGSPTGNYTTSSTSSGPVTGGQVLPGGVVVGGSVDVRVSIYDVWEYRSDNGQGTLTVKFQNGRVVDVTHHF